MGKKIQRHSVPDLFSGERDGRVLSLQTLCSGSSGNAALVANGEDALLIDFAPGTQRKCRALLEAVAADGVPIKAVFVTHAHSDHINENSLRVLAEADIPIICHPKVARQINNRYGNPHAARILPYESGGWIGMLEIAMVEVDHAPGTFTTAVSVLSRSAGGSTKAAVFTDLCAFGERQLDAARDVDLLLLEANHDLRLLEENRHPGSEWHLPNPASARFLHNVCVASSRQPAHVVLGHLSESCNHPELPVREVRRFFERQQTSLDCTIHTAPRHSPSKQVTPAE